MSRFAAITVTTLVLIVAINYTISPLLGYFTEKADEVRQNRSQLERFRILLAKEDAIEEQLRDIELNGSEADLFLSGSRPAIASANLREFLSDTVQSSGGKLISSQEYEVAGVNGATAIGLQFDVIGDTSNLVRLLNDIEESRPIIFIDKLMVTSSSSRVARASSVQNGSRNRSVGEQPQLRIRMSVLGYLLDSGIADDESK